MERFAVATITLALSGAIAFAAPSAAIAATHSSKPSPTPSPTSTTSTAVGYDVSWPQCSARLPTSAAFAIVGVNDGLATDTNPCSTTEISWAAKTAHGGTGQASVALYVNTADPGHQGKWWPTTNATNGGPVLDGLNGDPSDPYGSCTGAEDAACAYVYGYSAAWNDANTRGISNPGGYRWWLDVETGNTWLPSTATNRADLEAMTAMLQSIPGATVGVYSTSYQWGTIAGTIPTTSALNTLADWIPGASSAKGAAGNCSLPPLTAGGKVTMTQYTGTIDNDHSCI